MSKYIIQIIVLGTQAVGKAFAKAVRQEYQESQAAAQARYASGRRGVSRTAAENMRLGMTLEEARQILNAKPESTPEEISKSYEFLFNINDKSKGGSVYLQSKIFRAKERLDKEFRINQQGYKSEETADRSSANADKPPDRSEKSAR